MDRHDVKDDDGRSTRDSDENKEFWSDIDNELETVRMTYVELGVEDAGQSDPTNIPSEANYDSH